MTPTASGAVGPLSYGTLLVVRLGDGTTSPTTTRLVPTFIEEWALPTAGAGGAASKLQTLPMPSNSLCSSLVASSYVGQGTLSVSGDGSFLVFTCYNNSAGGTKPAAGSFGQVSRSGAVTLTYAPAQAGNTL